MILVLITTHAIDIWVADKDPKRVSSDSGRVSYFQFPCGDDIYNEKKRLKIQTFVPLTTILRNNASPKTYFAGLVTGLDYRRNTRRSNRLSCSHFQKEPPTDQGMRSP